MVENEDVVSLMALVTEGDVQFDEMVAERHKMGAEKYGPVNFLEIDSVEMAMEELADLANYARYTYIKLYIIQHYLQAVAPQVDSPNPLGPKSFSSSVGSE